MLIKLLKLISSKKIIFVLLLTIFFTSSIFADSLYNRGQSSFYGSFKREIRVGDILTVYISETTSALQEATTKTSKQSQIGSDLQSNWDQVANLLGNETIRKTGEFGISGDDQYHGIGSTSRTSRVKAVVSCVVTEVLESGNIYIVGEHQVKVNDEIETVRISGVVRPEDIRADNSVQSFQIAKAKVSVNGIGVVGAKQTPGVLTKMFNWLF